MARVGKFIAALGVERRVETEQLIEQLNYLYCSIAFAEPTGCIVRLSLYRAQLALDAVEGHELASINIWPAFIMLIRFNSPKRAITFTQLGQLSELTKLAWPAHLCAQGHLLRGRQLAWPIVVKRSLLPGRRVAALGRNKARSYCGLVAEFVSARPGQPRNSSRPCSSGRFVASSYQARFCWPLGISSAHLKYD